MSPTSMLLVSLAAILVASIYFLAYTATGITLILNSNIDDPSANISIANVSHNLDGSTIVNELNYTSDFADISFKHVTLNWNPLSIFSDQIVIEKLSGDHLSVNFKSTPPTGESLATIGFPVATNVINAKIQAINISANGKSIYAINNTAIENIFLEDSFFADKILLKSPNGLWVKCSGTFGFSDNSVINLTTESSFLIPAKNTTVHARGTLVGNGAQLRFMQELGEPISANISGRIKHLFTNPTWVLETQVNNLDLSFLPQGQFLKGLSGDISVQGHLNTFEAKSTFLFQDQENKTWTANVDARTNENNVDFNIDVKATKPEKNASASHASFQGKFDLTQLSENEDVLQRLHVQGNWNDFFVPFNKSHTVIARSGHIDFNGSRYIAKLTATDVQLNTLGPTLTKLVLNTHRDDNGELLFNGTATTADGNLKLSGSMVIHQNSFQMNNLFLNGNNFTLVRKPQAHIIVSPKLAFVRKNKVMTSTGTIRIPTANIQLQEFKNTLSTLAGLIDSSNRPIGSTGYIDVTFGKSVWMHGFGLNANVTGELSLQNLSNNNIVASGELNVLRGNYHNRKKELTLSGGRLKFNKIGIDDPELDLKTSPPNNVSIYTSNPVAGKIKGRLQKLYSDANKNVRAKDSSSQKANHQDPGNLALNASISR